MTSKYFNRVAFLTIGKKELSIVIRGMRVTFVRNFKNIPALLFANHQRHGILFTVKKDSALRRLVGEAIELLYIVFFRWKYIGMIPGNSTNDSDMVLIPEKLRGWVKGRG